MVQPFFGTLLTCKGGQPGRRDRFVGVDSQHAAQRGRRMEERRPLDPTRRMLRVFGVTVTDYEEKTGQIRAELATSPPTGELARLASEAVELTVDLNRQLREVMNHLLDAQTQV